MSDKASGRAKRISRRTVLRGLGTAMALPILEAMAPLAPARGATTSAAAASGLGASAAKAPTRLLWFYVPNGVHMPDWTPDAVGSKFDLPPTLAKLKDFQQQMLVLSGLAQDHAFAHGDGPGDHARSMATFLTGCQARKTAGADIHVGVSVDQLAAARVGDATRFPSLELGCEAGPQAGNCDSGYSCAYSANMSWKTDATPVAKEINPRLVFERLFSSDIDPVRAHRDQFKQSILDFVREDAGRLQRDLGRNDQRKLDEYMSSVRELELRLQRAEKEPPPKVPSGMAKPAGVPKDYGEHLRLMFDVLALALQTDSTRIATMVLANEGSNRSYPMIGVNAGHHEVSHHGGSKEKQDKIARINRFHMEHFAEFLGKLRTTKEGDGTLLDHSLIVYGSCIGDGNRHNHDELPVVLLGRGSGTVRSGRHIRYPKGTPLNNLWLSMLDRINIHPDQVGDSSGRLPQLDG
jgi:hypothetical protein